MEVLVKITMEKAIVKRMNILHSIINSIKTYLKNLSNSKYAFMLPFVLNNVLGTPDKLKDPDPLISYIASILTLQVILFFTLLNISFYIISLYLIKYYNIETKFPKYVKIINFYQRTNKYFLAFEIVLAIVIQFYLIIMNSLFLGILI